MWFLDANNTFKIDVEVKISEPEVKQKRLKEPKDAANETKAKKKAQIETATFKSNGNGAGGNLQNGIKTIKVWIRSRPLLVPVLEDMTADDWEAFIGQLQDKKN